MKYKIMKAKFVFESITNSNVLKPKEKDELDKLMVPIKIPFEKYSLKHSSSIFRWIKKGYDIRYTAKKLAMVFLYGKLNDIMIPFFSNDIIYELNNFDKTHFLDLMEDSELDKDKIYIKPHMSTTGRYDINYSNTWDMTDEEKAFAKTLYKGRGNEEFGFVLQNGIHIAFIISKSGKYVTLVLESLDKKFYNKVNHLFSKIPIYTDFYLNNGWSKPEDVINIIKELNKI